MKISSPAVATASANYSPEAPAPASAERISYSSDRYGTMENFVEHSDFELFKTQFRSGILGLVQFVRDDIVGSEPEKDRATKALKDDWLRFLEKLFPQKIGHELYRREEAYGRGKEAIDLLSALIVRDALPKISLIDSIKSLAPDLTVCLDGAAKHLADCANRLQQMLGGGSWDAFKQKRAEEHINAFLSSPKIIGKHKLYEGNNIHRVIGMSNTLADDFGLTKQGDSFANSWSIAFELIAECRRHLAPTMTRSALAHAFAEEYLAKITCAMGSSFIDNNTSTAFDRTPYIDILEHAMERLEPAYGLFGQNCIVEPLDDTYSRYRLLIDPSLIAKEILEKKIDMSGPQEAASNIQSAFKRELPLAPNAVCIETYGENIFWALDADGDSQVLTISHLQDISPAQCEGNFVAFINQVILNSQPHVLLEKFPAAWLPKADMAILATRLGEDGFSEFINMHKEALQKIPYGERLGLIKQIIANAPVNSLKRFAGNISDWFPVEADGRKASRILLPIAVERMDPDIIKSILTLPSSSYYSLTETSLENLCDTLSKVSSKPPARLAAQLFKWGEIAMDAHARKSLASGESKRMLENMAHAFAFAMRTGNTARIAAFGNFLLLGYDKGMLQQKDIAKLLTGSPSVSLLEGALSGRRTAAVTAFGNIVLAAYDMGVLNDKQVDNILACPPRVPLYMDHIFRTQGEALEQTDSATKIAFGGILRSFDFMRAATARSDRSALSFLKSNPGQLNHTKLHWLSVVDLRDFLETLSVEKEGLSTFLKDYKDELRKLPFDKRVEITRAIVELGSATDLKLLVKNDNRLFSPDYYADALPPQFLTIATERGDDDMIQAVGDLLLHKLKLAGKSSRHTKAALFAEIRNVFQGDAKPSKTKAMLYLRQMSEQAWRKGFLNDEEYANTFFTDAGAPSSEIADAMLDGNIEQIYAFNEKLLFAWEHKILNAGKIAMLLCGTSSLSSEKHVLIQALKRKNADAVPVFGALLKAWYYKGVLTMNQIDDLLDLKTSPSLQSLLNNSGMPAADAYRKIVDDASRYALRQRGLEAV